MVQYKTKVSPKGQVVIPSEVQKNLQLDDGVLVEIHVEDSVAVVKKAPSWVEQTAGIFSHPSQTGKPVTIEEMDKAVEEGILESWNRFVAETETEYDQ